MDDSVLFFLCFYLVKLKIWRLLVWKKQRVGKLTLVLSYFKMLIFYDAYKFYYGMGLRKVSEGYDEYISSLQELFCREEGQRGFRKRGFEGGGGGYKKALKGEFLDSKVEVDGVGGSGFRDIGVLQVRFCVQEDLELVLFFRFMLLRLFFNSQFKNYARVRVLKMLLFDLGDFLFQGFNSEIGSNLKRNYNIVLGIRFIISKVEESRSSFGLVITQI